MLFMMVFTNLLRALWGFLLVALAPIIVVMPARASQWAVSADDAQGLPTISIGGAVALRSSFVFWDKDWVWAGMQHQLAVTAPLNYRITAVNKQLDFTLSSEIKGSDRALAFEIELDARTARPDVIGGGIAFKFDLEAFGAALGEPELLTENRGWAWGKPGGPRFEMRFDPPLARTYFERGQKSEIRAFFYSRSVPAGKMRHSATLAISGPVVVVPAGPERFGLEDVSSWTTNILEWPIAPWNMSPVDLSFLNVDEKPAGKRGFVKSQGEKLIFEDGTIARFWGTNLTAYALFQTDRENTRSQARRLSQLGFNLVRLHHHDSSWVNPNVFGDLKGPNTQTLSAAALDKLDWWIKCLKDEGIYVWLDLHVGRQFKADDAIQHFDEIRKGRETAELTGYNYVNQSIQQAMQRFNEAYLDHLNPYTSLRYKDDPAIIALLLTNENDITNHFGNALLPDKKVPQHNAIFMAEAAAFAAKHGLLKDKTWRSWEHGPSKIFLNDLEHRFNIDQIGHIRRLGARAAIVTTSTWGSNPVSALPALTGGDIIAVHSYGGVGELEKNPSFAANFAHWMAAAQVVDKPLMVPEWNVEKFPVPDRHAVPLYVAGIASLQGWDGLMQYAYSQQGLVNRGGPSNWHAFNDPALIATMPAAALLFRRRDAQEAQTTYVFAPDKEQLFGRFVSAGNSPALRSAAEKGRLLVALPAAPELAWLKPSKIPTGATVLTDPAGSLIDKDAEFVVSDTGELKRNWRQGVYTIDTPRTQSAMGWIGGKHIDLSDIEISVATRNATVAVQSLNHNPIKSSRSLMLSLGARAVPNAGNKVPFHAEPVLGRVAIRAPAGLKVYAQHAPSVRTWEVPARYTEGRYHIELTRELETYWLFLR